MHVLPNDMSQLDQKKELANSSIQKPTKEIILILLLFFFFCLGLIEIKANGQKRKEKTTMTLSIQRPNN